MLLTPELRRFFARLSVFRGGWTVEAAETACEEPLASDYLMQLAEFSVVHLDQQVCPEPRYRMLEMIRQYAAKQLEASGDRRSISDKHFYHFYELVRQYYVNRRGPDARFCLDALDADHGNLLAALEWCAHNPDKLDDALGLAYRLKYFWTGRGHFALGRGVVERLLRLDCDRPPTVARAGALTTAGLLAFEQGDTRSARASYSEALEIARLLNSRFWEAVALGHLGIVAERETDYTSAKTLFSNALEMFRLLAREKRGDMPGRLTDISPPEAPEDDLTEVELNASWAVSNLGVIAFNLGEWDTAWGYFSEHVDFLRKHGSRGLSTALTNLGNVANAKGDHALRDALHEEALAVARETEKNEVRTILFNMGASAHNSGDFQLAERRWMEALKIARQLDDKHTVARTLLGLAILCLRTGVVSQRISCRLTLSQPTIGTHVTPSFWG